MLRASVGHLVVSAPLILVAACGSKGQTGTGTGGSMNNGGSGGAAGTIGAGGSAGTAGSAGTGGGGASGGGAATGGSGASAGTGGGGAGGTSTGAGGGCPPPPSTNGDECHPYDSQGYYAAGFFIVDAACTPGVKCSFWASGGLNVCAQNPGLQPTICCQGWGFVTGLTSAVCPTLPAGEDPRCPPTPNTNCSPDGLACTWEAVADNGAGGGSGAGRKYSFPRVCCQGRWWYPDRSPCSADAGAD
jgi:hypothetical protein